MNPTSRLLPGILALTMVAMTAASAGEAGTYHGRTHPCLCKLSTTDFDRAPDVWWGHQRRSFGNYLAFDKAVIPEPPVKRPVTIGIVYFDLDKSILRPDGIRICKKIHQYLVEHPNEKVVISGYCCDLAGNEYNQALGRRRADAVKKFLVDHGIRAGRIKTVSYGEEHLLPGTVPDRRPLNRRAVVVAITSRRTGRPDTARAKQPPLEQRSAAREGK